MLPNGDTLVAETNAPPKPEDGKGIKGWVMKLVMKDAGAGVPSANRITLLRDTDGDGVAEMQTAFLEGLNSPFGMALMLSKSSTEHAPWYVIPANHKWFRDLAISQIMVEYLEGLNMKFPPPSVDINQICKKYHSEKKRA